MAVIERTLARLRDHLGMDVAYISELAGDEMIIRAHCAPDLKMDLPDQITLPRKDGFCHHLASGEIPSIIHDSSQDAVAADLPTRAQFGIEAYIGLPLEREDGTVYGTLCCFSHAPNQSLNRRDLRTVKLFADIVSSQIDEELEDRRLAELRNDRIQSVFDNERIRSVFQPIVRLSDFSCKGFEALSRFDADPYLTPDVWFREAVQVDRGIELEIAAIRRAFSFLPRLPKPYTLGLNVSPECLLSEDLDDALFGQEPSQIILEVTEHAQVENYDALCQAIHRLKKRGYCIAVDDAGAGYASLSHIVQLQPDIIKLDISLTRNVNTDRVRRSLANAMVFFAKETDAKIVAEGIETHGEMYTLADLGVDYGQGYFFDKPLEADDALKWLAIGADDDKFG